MVFLKPLKKMHKHSPLASILKHNNARDSDLHSTYKPNSLQGNAWLNWQNFEKKLSTLLSIRAPSFGHFVDTLLSSQSSFWTKKDISTTVHNSPRHCGLTLPCFPFTVVWFVHGEKTFSQFQENFLDRVKVKLTLNQNLWISAIFGKITWFLHGICKILQ